MPLVLPTSQDPPCWDPSWLDNMCTTRTDPDLLGSALLGQRPPGNDSHPRKTRDCEPRGRAVLLGSVTSPPRAPLTQKFSCFISTCISRDHSSPRVRQAPALLVSASCRQAPSGLWRLLSFRVQGGILGPSSARPAPGVDAAFLPRALVSVPDTSVHAWLVGPPWAAPYPGGCSS